MQNYTAQRGETRRWVLYAPLGTDLTDWSASCRARQFDLQRRAIASGATVAAELSVSTFAGDSERGPGWYLTLSAAACEALAVGVYQIDARIVLPGGEVAITDAWLLFVREPATEAAE